MPPRPQRPPQRPPAPQPPPQEEPPREIIRDTFQKFKKDPRINTAVLKETKPRPAEKKQQNDSPLLTKATDTIFQLSREFGLPSFLSSYKQTQEVNWALLVDADKNAIEQTQNFDVVYSNRGETYGKKNSINNQLFFEKAFPQKKVFSYDHFIDYHMNKAADTERLHLVGLHVLSADANFVLLLETQIARLVFERPLSPEFEQTLLQMRHEVFSNHPDFFFAPTQKDATAILSLLRATQLAHGRVFPQLRQRSVFDLFAALKPLSLFSPEQLQKLTAAYSSFLTQNNGDKT
jgi:hypothetical protein